MISITRLSSLEAKLQNNSLQLVAFLFFLALLTDGLAEYNSTELHPHPPPPRAVWFLAELNETRQISKQQLPLQSCSLTRRNLLTNADCCVMFD